MQGKKFIHLACCSYKSSSLAAFHEKIRKRANLNKKIFSFKQIKLQIPNAPGKALIACFSETNDTTNCIPEPKRFRFPGDHSNFVGTTKLNGIKTRAVGKQF